MISQKLLTALHNHSTTFTGAENRFMSARFNAAKIASALELLTAHAEGRISNHVSRRNWGDGGVEFSIGISSTK
jgi:hypothetical protein